MIAYEELAAQPRREAGYRFVPTGKTFAEHWGSLDSAGKNDYLRNHGVRLSHQHMSEAGRKWHLEIGEFLNMLAGLNPEIAQNLAGHGQAFRNYMNEAMTSA